MHMRVGGSALSHHHYFMISSFWGYFLIIRDISSFYGDIYVLFLGFSTNLLLPQAAGSEVVITAEDVLINPKVSKLETEKRDCDDM